MHKIKYIFLSALIIFLPLQGLFVALLHLNQSIPASLVFWLSRWYEPVLVAWVLYLLFGCIFGRRCINWRLLNKPASYFVLLAGISALFLAQGVSRGLEGFRFTAFPVLIFLLLQTVALPEQKKQRLVGTYLFMAALVAVWGLLERFLPFNYWQTLGLLDFGWGKYNLVEKYYQSASLLDGPNQLASYLLPAIFVAIDRISKNTKKIISLDLVPYYLLVLLGTAALLLTFSRSAFVALALTALLFFFLSQVKTKWKISVAVIMAIVLAGAIAIIRGNAQFLDTVVYHGASHLEHQGALTQSWATIRGMSFDEKMIGLGIGSAGPAAMKYGDGIISESWYLQLILEVGLLGLALWIWLIADIFWTNYKVGRKGIAFAIIAVSIAALFLHTWADNPAIAITVFIMAGVYGGRELKKK